MMKENHKVLLTASQLTALRQLIGEEKVLTSEEEKVVYSYDASKRKYPPSAIVLPRSRDDIVKVMRFAYEENIPVYPRGSGSGMSGGSLPVYGGIALVFTQMNKIIEIDEVNQSATVEPGVVLSELQHAAGRLNLFYPPDPASAEFASIGGTLAECAGGLRCVKYGVTRDYVLWLEVVRMGGEVLQFGSDAVKSVSGYDILRLLVGSEGTLAVFSKIKVRLLPRPETAYTLLATFSDEITALGAGIELLKNAFVPSALEFIDSLSLQCAYDYSHDQRIKDVRGVLLIEFDGKRAQVEHDCSEAREFLSRRAGALNVEIATDRQSIEALWQIRRYLSPALFQLGPTKYNEDIAVPRSELVATFKAIKELADRHKLTIAVFGHCGDGNLHVNFMFDENNKDEKARVEQAIPELFQMVIQRRGTISGEHGIGIMKLPYLSLEYGEAELRIMREIKSIWDPKNLLNPGKIFPSDNFRTPPTTQ
ncbi:FAD-binding protein [Candidatus Sumerlaeota bacterium]|nr:FAD-binding protein [Candidatus Sumerlaeota bacterium]